MTGVAGSVIHGGLMLEQSVPEGVCSMEGTHVGAVCGGLYSMGGTAGCCEKEGVAETRCYEPSATPTPYPLHPF